MRVQRTDHRTDFGGVLYVPHQVYKELCCHTRPASGGRLCGHYDGGGNIGTGVAVAGAFNLVRFRSVPGSAKEIGAIFLAMGTGLLVGMGYIGYAFLCAVLLGFVSALLNGMGFGAKKHGELYKTLRITIPEDLDYTDVFTPILQEYTSAHELTQVKTTNMGSLFKLTYDVTLRSTGEEKQMLDKLRCRNGNLEISISNQETNASVL